MIIFISPFCRDLKTLATRVNEQQQCVSRREKLFVVTAIAANKTAATQ